MLPVKKRLNYVGKKIVQNKENIDQPMVEQNLIQNVIMI